MATSMKDADSKFSDAVSSIQLDLEGQLAVKCTGSCEWFRCTGNPVTYLGLFSTRTFSIRRMDGEFVRVDGELFG